VILLFRRLLVQYEEVRVKCAQCVGEPDLGRQTSDLYTTWASFVPGGPVTDKSVRENILVMTEEAFAIVCEQNLRDVHEGLRDDLDDDDDVLEDDPLERRSCDCFR
jgi:hypothetical protein